MPTDQVAVLLEQAATGRTDSAILVPPPRPEVAEFSDWLVDRFPGWSWDWRHLALIRRKLDRVDARELDRLIIITPPRHGKSEHTTVRWSAHRLERRPAERIIIGAHSQSLSRKFSRGIRRIVRDGGVALSREVYNVDEWETAENGGVRACGVGTGVAGYGAELVQIDDPVRSRKEAKSQAYRDACYDWYTDDLYTRLEPDGALVLTQTRWDVDDLAGRLIKASNSGEGDKFEIVHLPALCDDPESDLLGRTAGEALEPRRYTRKQLLRIRGVLRRRMGEMGWNSLFQGRPTALEGDLVQRAWFRFAHQGAFDSPWVIRVQTIDCANKGKEIADGAPSVIQTWDCTRTAYHLVAEWRDWVSYPALKAAAKKQAELHEPGAVLIEDKGNGQALLQDLAATTRIPLISVEPLTDKVTRFAAQTAAIEAGLVILPEGEAWTAEWLDEVCAYPGAYQDRGDALSQFLAWARLNAGRFEFETTGQARVGIEAAAAEANAILESDKDFGFGRVKSSTDTRGF